MAIPEQEVSLLAMATPGGDTAFAAPSPNQLVVEDAPTGGLQLDNSSEPWDELQLQDEPALTPIADPLASSAAQTMAAAQQQVRRKQSSSSSEEGGLAAMGLLAGGLCLIAFGIGATIWSYTAATEGEKYYVFTGLIVVGVGMVFKGGAALFG